MIRPRSRAPSGPRSRPPRGIRGAVLRAAAVSAAIAGAAAAGLLAFLLVLARDPRPGLPASLPAGCGAEGPGFRVLCADGAPWLLAGGLPYPAGYDTADHPVQSLDGTWAFRADSADAGLGLGWSRGLWADSAPTLQVPSTYNAPAGPWKGHEGPVWFARRFHADPADPGRWTRLTFDGVLLRSRAWLNGIPLGEREGGYTPFHFDVTSRLRPGGNVLVVRADNRLTYASLPPRVRPRHNPVWGVYGGIHRGVRLESVPELSMFKIAARAYRESGREIPADGTAAGGADAEAAAAEGTAAGGAAAAAGFEVEVLVHARAAAPACTLSLALAAPSGGPAASARAVLPAIPEGGPPVVRAAFRLPLPRVDSWGPGRPALYTLEARLAGGPAPQALRVRLGHRILAFGDGVLRLDGRRLFLKGVSKMEDHPLLGQTQDEASLDRDLELVRELGANYLRLAHYPHDVREVRRARDAGLMVAEEIPYFHVGAGWSQWLVDFQGLDGFPFSAFGLRQLHRRDLLLHAQQSLVELIERDLNNPAVILWSLGNESYSLGNGAGRVYGWLRETARAFDPGRPSTMAEMTYYVPWLDRLRASARHLDLASINAYYGWYFGAAEGIARHLDDFHARNPGKDVILSEFGAEAALGRAPGDGTRTGDRVFFPRTYAEAYQADVLERHVRIAWERPWVAGVSPWVFADFYCPWFPHNPVPEYNTKGLLTRERVPKQGFHRLRELYRSLPDYRE